MISGRCVCAGASVCWVLGIASVARATLSGQPAATVERYALVIGVNKSVDTDLPRLRYADDDAVKYFELFQLLGFRTFLLATLDENTARLHRRASGEASPATSRALGAAVQLLAESLAKARHRGHATVLYFVYAGHGNVKGGTGYITLEDRRLTGSELRRNVFDQARAGTTHLIVDACHSFYLAYSRGPGGRRRKVRGFTHLTEAFPEQRFGLLLSTSTARASHEWEGFQAGVFSHEVRSGLYGAADVDGDGRVSYREIAAFISRANAAIDNERFRPRIYARAPTSDGALIDLRNAQHILRIAAHLHGRYLLEDNRGVRIADFHSGAGQSVTLLRPVQQPILFLRRIEGEEQEYEIRGKAPVVQLSGIASHPPSAQHRGAAHWAFTRLFSLPFDRAFVQRFAMPNALAKQKDSLARGRWSWLDYLGWGAAGGGLAAVAAGVALSFAAAGAASDDATLSQVETASRNDEIAAYNAGAAALYAVGGVALVGGAVALLWSHKTAKPEKAKAGRLTAVLSVGAGSTGASVGLAGRF